MANAADDAVRPRLPADYRPDLDALLDRVAPPQCASWLRGLAALLDGMHGAAVAPDVLGEALRAFGANGAEPKWKLFVGYVRRAAEAPDEHRVTSVAVVALNGTHPAAPSRAERAGADARARALRGAQAVNAIAGRIGHDL